jgi:WhiB family redox-sensing transcriptional regulator
MELDGAWPRDMLRFPPGPPLDDGACRTADLSLFFPPAGESAAEARAICSTCPAQPECLAFALSVPTLSGIWGGTSGLERQRLRRPLHLRRRRAG